MQKCLVLASALLMAGALFGGAIAWKGGVDTSWNTAANWEPETVPNANGAEVDLSAASGTIDIASAVTVGSLTLSPASGKTVTITGQKLTFASSSTPTVTVGKGSTLITQCSHGGTQGVLKMGAGAFNPYANVAADNFSGTFEIREGSSAPAYKNASGYFSSIKVCSGATFTIAKGDMYHSNQTFLIAGGTLLQNGGDYIGAITFSDGGTWNGKNNQVYLENGAAVTATGTGLAGRLTNSILRVNGIFSKPTNNPLHIQPFDIGAGATFLFSGYIYEGLAQGPGDFYMLDYRNDCSPAKGAARKLLYGGMTKKGGGDLVLYGDYRSTLTKATTIESGRLILSNNFKICLSPVSATNAASLVFAPGQTSSRVGALDMRDGTLDLGGNTVDVGGADGTANQAAKVTNGSIRKISHTKQTVAGLSQSAVEVYGGALNLGIPAPVVRYDFDDAAAPLNDSGALGKHLAWSSDDAGAWHSAGGVRGGCVEFTKAGPWERSGDANKPETWVFTYGGGWLEAATCEGLPKGDTPIAITAWVKPNSTVTYKQALAGWGRWGAELNAAGTGNAGGYHAMGLCISREKFEGDNYQSNVLFSRPWSGDWKSPSVPNLDDGNWHHVAYVYDPTYHVDRYYVDGDLFLESTTLATTAFTIDTTRKFTVGGGQLYASTFMGKIDELMVFDRALGAEQVKLLASSPDTATRTATLAANATAKVARDASLGFGAAAPQTLSSLTGDGALTLNDSTVTLNNASDANAATVTGSGTLVKRGAGTLTLDRATATGGRIDVKEGGVALKGGAVSSALRTHLKGWWNFNDPANPLADASGNGLDLITPTNAYDNSTWHEGWNWRNHFEKMGGAAYFGNDNKQTLVCTNVAALTKALPRGNASFTIALWVNPETGVAGNGNFFTYYHATYGNEGGRWNMFRFNNTNGKRCLHHVFYSGSGDQSSAPLDDAFLNGDEFSGWHHVAYTYDKDKKIERFYVDGAQLGSDIASIASPDMQTEMLCIGGSMEHHQNDGAPFKGYLDDVMIFDTVLTADEIAAVKGGIFDEPTGGAAVTAAAGTTLDVTVGTVGLGSVNGAGGVSVANAATLVLGAGDSEPTGTFAGPGAIRLTGTASLRLPSNADYNGPLTVDEGAALRCTPGQSASVDSLALAEGARFLADYGESSTPCWNVSGTVALPERATIDFNGPFDGTSTSVVLLQADSLSGDVTGWTINVSNRLVSSVTKQGNKVVLTLTRRGMAILIR